MMRTGTARVAGGAWWIEEPGEPEPANFHHDDYPDVNKDDPVSFDRDENDFKKAINIHVLASLTSRDLAIRLAALHDVTQVAARKMVDAVFSAIADAASQGDEVSLSGFGKFKVNHYPTRTGRHPRTGESIEIAASRKLKFTPAKAIKDRL